MPGEVIVQEGADAGYCRLVSIRLTEVINAFEDHSLSSHRDSFTNDGYAVANDLLLKTGMRNARPTHRTKLISINRDGWEIRDIKVKVDLRETAQNDVLAATDPTEYLVFELTPDGLIDNLTFSVQKAYVDQLVKDGLKLQDAARRMKILQTVEIFRTAYCRKDLDYLKQIYSDDALIIVGKVLKPREDLPDMLENSGLSESRVQFIKQTKAQYISGLERAFQRNAYVKVVFDSLEVLRHNGDPDLYGVTLKQDWYSSTYSDTGWVFLLWDFKDEENPTIYVRSWQPERFEDGSIIGLYHFKIERGRADK